MGGPEGIIAPSGLEGLVLHMALGTWGICSWIVFNGLWGQLPHFVRTLPEGNRLGVLMIAAEQLAFVFPLYFTYKKRPQANRKASQERDIWLLLLTGLAVSLLLSRYWDWTTDVGGQPHCVGLLLLTFVAGGMCTSTGVVFTPYLADYPKSYTSAYSGGAGLSGLLVALMTLAADSGAEHPRLPIDRYFQLLSVVFVMSALCFLYVRHTLSKHDRYLPVRAEEPPVARVTPAEGKGSNAAGKGYGSTASSSSKGTSVQTAEDTQPAKIPVLWPVFVLQCLLASLAYGVVPSVLPIACTGYNDSPRVLMLATAGFMIADPLGKFLTACVWAGVWGPGLTCLGLAILLVSCAAVAPQPPFYWSAHGGYLPVAANTLFSLTFSFTATSIFFQRRVVQEKLSRAGESAADAYKWFTWSAFMIQTGAFLGTFITLAVVLST